MDEGHNRMLSDRRRDGDLLMKDNGNSNPTKKSKKAESSAVANMTNSSVLDETQLLQQKIGAGIDYYDTVNNGNNQYHFTSYPATTTFFLIILLHAIFVYHWLLRKSRRDVLVSYRVVVQKKQYHKLWLAMLSHPPAKHQHQRGLPHSSSNLEDDSEQDFLSRSLTYARQYADWAYQSGFALMLYNSHILWSCRALEVYYNTVAASQYYRVNAGTQNQEGSTVQRQAHGDETDIKVHPLQYARVLFSLTMMALLLELRLASLLLRIAERTSESDLSIGLPENDRQDERSAHLRMQQKIIYRSIGTLTALSCALLVVFQHHFEYVPLQVLPFFDNRWLLLGISLPASITPFLCLVILGILAMPSHPFASILYGLLSGVLWSIGVTSFLQEPYWGNALIIAVAVMSCASIKAGGYRRRGNSNAGSPATWVPCIDFVSWNRRGELIRSSEERERGSALSEEEDETMQSTDDESSEGSFRDDDLYGRLPDLTDNLDGDEEGNLEIPSVREDQRTRTMRSRRGASTA